MTTQFNSVLEAGRRGAQVQYFVTVGYDSEWTDYEGTAEPEDQPSRLDWRIKPATQAERDQGGR